MKSLSRLSLTVFFIVIIVYGMAAYSPDERFFGRVYLAGTNPPELIFTHENLYERSGDSETLTHVYKTPDGATATVERVTLKEGLVDRYEVDFSTSECGCLLTRKGEDMEFSFTRGEKDKRGVRSYESNLVTGPTLNAFAAKNLDRLRAGNAAELYLAAMPFQQVVKFRLTNDQASRYNRAGAVVLKMVTANPLFRLFAEPVYLVVDEGSKRITEIHGKSLLERVVNGKKENPVVDIYYTFPVQEAKR